MKVCIIVWELGRERARRRRRRRRCLADGWSSVGEVSEARGQVLARVSVSVSVVVRARRVWEREVCAW
jgi:hypothetical protein